MEETEQQMRHTDPTIKQKTANNMSIPSLTILLIYCNTNSCLNEQRYQDRLFSNETIFHKLAIFYEGKLNESGYNTALKYTAVINTKVNKKAQNRNIIWFNSPFSKNVSSNIGEFFLKTQLISTSPVDIDYTRSLTDTLLKVSYSCMKNMKTIINNHNSRILDEKRSVNSRACTLFVLINAGQIIAGLFAGLMFANFL